MSHFAQVLEDFSGIAVGQLPRAGAAGGMGAAVVALLGGQLVPGAELLLDSVGFDTLLEQADMVFTGEGRIDWQSVSGKVPGTVAARCRKANVPCIALCGSVGRGAEDLYDAGIAAIFSAVRGAADFDSIRETCAEDLFFLTDAVVRLLALSREIPGWHS